MISEAATVEAVWAIEPTLLESLLIQEIDDFYSEKVWLHPLPAKPNLSIETHQYGAAGTLGCST